MAFPWDSFSANTLRAMAADVYKSQDMPNPVPNKAETIALLEKIEKFGLEKALKSASSSKKAAVEDESASVRTRGKRKHNDVEEEDEAAVNGDEGDEEDGEGDEEDESSLQASNKENEVSLLELATTRTEDDEVINRENDISLLEIATGRTEEGDDEVHKGVEMPEPEPEKAGPAPEEPEPPIGSPVPANEQPTDDQIEEARLHDSSIGAMAAPAENDTPEITIEPTADEASGSGSHVAENGHATDNGDGQGLLRPRIITSREGSVPLNPEYSIEVYSPASAVHDSDDENWVAKGVNGKGDGSRGTGGGLAELAPLNAGEPLVSVTPAGGLEFNFTVDNEDQGHMAGLDHLYDNL
ncbi:acidPPc domain-containing protein [Mycena kentingensis (nom. inval.)]|nr:acidPPc domain-containing protein [Mycena kentingensis (nom. inval.)]